MVTYSILFLLMIKVFFKTHTQLGLTSSFSKFLYRVTLFFLDELNYERVSTKGVAYVGSLWAIINILFFVLGLSKSIDYTN